MENRSAGSGHGGRVVSIQRGDVMSLIKFEVTTPAQMASVIKTESVGKLTIGRI